MKTVRKNPLIAVIRAFTVLGLALSIYLSYIYAIPSAESFCGPGSGCDTVRLSSYSYFLGIPVPIWGIVGYSALLMLSFLPLSRRRKWLFMYFVSLLSLSFSAYLTYIEVFVLNTICPFCVASAVFILIVFSAVLAGKPKAVRTSPAAIGVLSVMLLLIVSLGSHVVQSEGQASPPPDSRRARLAQHLTRTGAAMYGVYWCPHCDEQKKLFGDAFEYVTYIDCDPKAPRDSNPSLCRAKNITRYPTWLIDGRRYIGVKSLRELEYLSGFNLREKR